MGFKLEKKKEKKKKKEKRNLGIFCDMCQLALSANSSKILFFKHVLDSFQCFSELENALVRILELYSQ